MCADGAAELVQLSDFFAKAAKTADNPLCDYQGKLSFPLDFGRIWRKEMPAAKSSVRDVREEILDRLLKWTQRMAVHDR
jgi:hypothetical protein